MAGRGRPRHIRIFLEGYDRAWKKAKTLEEAIPLLMTSALHSEAKRMMRRSQQLVPRDTGALAASGYVEKPIVYPHHSTVELGYNSDYAVRVHETPRSGQTEGVGPGPRYQPYRSWATTGQWKFLEEAANEVGQTSILRMREEIFLNLKTFLSRT